jgi:hypothetical protein
MFSVFLEAYCALKVPRFTLIESEPVAVPFIRGVVLKYPLRVLAITPDQAVSLLDVKR